MLYNASGRIGVRAARVSPDTIANHKLYHLSCSTESEVAYLITMLNADCLQEAYRQSQKTRRQFDHHIWRAVPIPKYDSLNSIHLELVVLCSEAEDVAQSIRDSFRDDVGQRKLSAAIHHALRECGIGARIDAAARKLMPEQAR